MEQRIKITAFLLSMPVAFLASSVSPLSEWVHHTGFFVTAAAEDDEGEQEDDERDEREGASDARPSKTSTPKTKTVRVMKEVIEYRPVVKTVMVTEEAYARDTDGDQLVDAIDPDPRVPQSEYFTDTDGDGVPNAIDRHHDEDDFNYYEFETDDNNNGILDSYEE